MIPAPTDSAAGIPRAGQVERGIFYSLMLLFLIPIWAFRYFPSHDGPSHLYNAVVVARLMSGKGTPYKNFLQVHFTCAPNLGYFALIIPLTRLFGPLIAEKLALTVYAIATPLCFRYVIRGFRGTGSWASSGIFLLLYNPLLIFGFFNFCFGIPLFLLTFGFWVRHGRRVNWKMITILTLLFMLLFFSHLHPFLSVFVAIAVYLGWEWMLGQQRPALIRAGCTAAISAAPALICLVCYFFLSRGGAGLPGPSRPFFYRIPFLFTILLAMDWKIDLPLSLVTVGGGLALAAALAFITWRSRKLTEADGLFVIGVAFLFLYQFGPANAAGGGFVIERTALIMLLMFALWLATIPLSGKTAAFLQSAVVLLSLVRLVGLLVQFNDANHLLGDILSAEPHLKEGSTIIAVEFTPIEPKWHGRQARSEVWLQSVSYVAIDRQLVDLRNYESILPYFITRYLPGRAFSSYSTYELPHIAEFEKTAGVIVDYVMVSPFAEQGPTTAAEIDMMNQLNAEFDLIYTSPMGTTRIFKNRNSIQSAH